MVFLLSTTLHEAGHAWAAMLGGDLTAYHGGQVSLSPVPHIRREPFGMLILPLLTVAVSGWPFGYASAPYDIRWAARHPKRAAWRALAGPGANILLILLALVSIRIGVAGGVFQSPDSVVFDRITAATAGGIWPGIAFFLSVVFSLNLVLALLNLLPLPPLDGSGAIPLFLNESQTVRYQQFLWGNPALGWIGILVAWQLFDVVWQPTFLFAVNLVYPGVTYG
jgi:Zn-dependent protease